MATLTWVGANNASWTTASSWSPASVPTGTDDVIFPDPAFGASINVGISGNAYCKSMTVNTALGDYYFYGGSGTLNIAGSLTVANSNAYFDVNVISFYSTTTGNTITTNGCDLDYLNNSNQIQFNGAGGTWTLGSGISNFGAISLITGTLNLGGYSITGGKFISGSGNTRSLTTGVNTINLSDPAPWVVNNAGNGLTLSITSSTINFSFRSPTVDLGDGHNYGALTFTNPTAGSNVIAGDSVIASLSISPPDSPSETNLVLLNGLQVGTFNVTGFTSTARLLIRSNTPGTARLLTVTGSWSPAIPDNIDFKDINYNSGILNVSTTNCGNFGGNTNIIFRAGRTVYWNLGGTSRRYYDNGWALTSGGAANSSYFPLAQDSIVLDGVVPSFFIINEEYSVTNVTINTANAFTFSVDIPSKRFNVLGNWVHSGGVSFASSSTGNINFGGLNTQTITTNGINFGSVDLEFDGGLVSGGQTVQLVDNVTTTGAVRVYNCYLTLNGKTLTCNDIQGIAPPLGNYAYIDYGTNSTLVLTGAGTVFQGPLAPYSVSVNATVSCTSASTKTVNLYYIANPFTLNNGGVGPLIIGNVGFSAYSIDGISNSVSPGAITFSVGQIVGVSTFNVSGTSGSPITINSDTPGLQATLYKVGGGTVNSSYLTVQDSVATGPVGTVWNALLSTNNGNNTGWNFTAPPPPVVTATGAFFQLF